MLALAADKSSADLIVRPFFPLEQHRCPAGRSKLRRQCRTGRSSTNDDGIVAFRHEAAPEAPGRITTQFAILNSIVSAVSPGPNDIAQPLAPGRLSSNNAFKTKRTVAD